MSLLFRSILQGLGWELGKSAAKEAVDDLRATGDEHKRAHKEALKSKREADRAQKAAEKTAKKSAKARATEAKRREREVDSELAELKKSLSRDD